VEREREREREREWARNQTVIIEVAGVRVCAQVCKGR